MRKAKSDSVLAGKIIGQREHGRKMGLEKRKELKHDSTERQELAAKYYRFADDDGLPPEDRAYYQAFADALMGVKTTEMAHASAKTSSKQRAYSTWDAARVWRNRFSRMFSMPFNFSFAAAGGGGSNDSTSDDDGVSGEEPAPQSHSRAAGMPIAIAELLGMFIGTIAGSVVTGNFGLGLVCGGIVMREIYARKAETYNPWAARIFGLALPALTLMGTMWPFGVALAVHLWAWQYVPWFYQEPESESKTEESEHPKSM